MDEITPEFLTACGFRLFKGHPTNQTYWHWERRAAENATIYIRRHEDDWQMRIAEGPVPCTRSRLRSLWHGLTGERLDSRASEADDDAVLVCCDKLEDIGMPYVADRVREMVDREQAKQKAETVFASVFPEVVARIAAGNRINPGDPVYLNQQGQIVARTVETTTCPACSGMGYSRHGYCADCSGTGAIAP